MAKASGATSALSAGARTRGPIATSHAGAVKAVLVRLRVEVCHCFERQTEAFSEEFPNQLSYPQGLGPRLAPPAAAFPSGAISARNASCAAAARLASAATTRQMRFGIIATPMI